MCKIKKNYIQLPLISWLLKPSLLFEISPIKQRASKIKNISKIHWSGMILFIFKSSLVIQQYQIRDNQTEPTSSSRPPSMRVITQTSSTRAMSLPVTLRCSSKGTPYTGFSGLHSVKSKQLIICDNPAYLTTFLHLILT